ncbi:lectin subunit alpha-like [Stomoxys calcitrans]|uniref:C-type lectin domain-containing protein n=1 Tax=Stomoxys calcitrans TaxID=35570 RepID=A0A1I8NTU4_STOCA|nr:lectin subunit alpha-like [Stomoxys calcitrans]
MSKTLLIIRILILHQITWWQLVDGVPVEKWFELQPNHRVFIERDYRYNWFQARNECLLKNMSLITVDTSEKSAALTSLLKRIFDKPHNLWLGGDDLGQENVFVWSSSGKRFEFTNWSHGNPSHNRGQEHCVNLWDATDFEWNDAPCNELKGFICEDNVFMLAARKEVERMKKVLLEIHDECSE